jgi:outer membrane protein assembly factor BamB
MLGFDHAIRGVWGATALACAALVVAAAPARAGDVLTYHNSNKRSGLYAVPGLTTAAAASLQLDSNFKATITGNVYSQPLYWKPKGSKTAELIVATESNNVYALNAATGAVIWERSLPAPISGGLPCGDINPEGITGTPVIDPATGTLYLNSQSSSTGTPQHNIYALSLKDGSILSGWPINVVNALQAVGVTFHAPEQGERSGLLFFQGALYLAYGGRAGDCTPYNGVIVQIDPTTQTLAGNWETRGDAGGIWAQGGVSSDGKYLFATTGNTIGVGSTYGDGESIEKLLPGLAHSTDARDFYAPANWQSLDASDADLGGTEALPISVVKTGGGTAPRIVALGKDGNAYLVNRLDLGGIGGAASIQKVSNQSIITGPAVYNTSTATLLAFTSFNGTQCSGNNITMLDLASSGSTPITIKWCAAFSGNGAPIITTTDGSTNPLVWVVGAGGDGILHGFDALTGAVVYTGSTKMSGLNSYQTLIAAEDHFYVAANNTVYAYKFKK